MKKFLMVGLSALLSVTAQAGATVVGVTADAARRRVTVDYTLSGDESQIVTIELFENGTLLPEKVCANVVGDVNRLVEPTTGDEIRRIYWETDGVDLGRTSLGVISARLSTWTKASPPDYMVYDFIATNSVRYYVSTNALPGGIGNIAYRKEKMVFRRIPAAGVEWYMGSPEGENGRSDTDGMENRHLVRLTKDYYMAVFETTYGQSAYLYAGTGYGQYRADNSLNKDGDPTCALGSVAYWHLKDDVTDAAETGRPIGHLQNRSGIAFDLPTEAQWEFACRAGTGKAMNSDKNLGSGYWDKMNPASMRALGWIYYGSAAEDGNAYGPRPVGQKQPNAWGLYDMHGNVSEFCRDVAYATFVTSDVVVENPINTTGYDGNRGRILRGGYYQCSAADCRSAKRSAQGKAGAYKGYGFRLIAPIPLN